MNNKSEIVSRYIEKLIISKELKPGDKIPSEIKLAEQLGVSRVSVRSGIAHLSAMGLLSKVKGGGTFVNKYQTNDYISNFLPSMLFEEIDYLEMLEFRQALDGLCVEQCIKHLNDVVISDLKKIIYDMEQSQNSEDFILYDKQFHLRISEAANNSLIHRVNLLIWNVLEKHAIQQYKLIDNDVRVIEHKAIFNSIVSKDIELAKIYSNRHLHRTINDVKLQIK